MPKQESFYQKWRTLIILFAVILILYAFAWVGMAWYFDNKDQGIQAGTFGDQFGAINALFSGLALAGVIYTLIQQQKEMQAQRREFMTTRAMNSVYKQIDLVNNTITSLKCYRPEMDADGMISHQNTETYTDYDAIDVLQREVHEYDNPHANLPFLSYYTNFEVTYKIARVLSNSCQVLTKIRMIEKMDDQDSSLMIETFKYNIDQKVWDFITTLIRYANTKDNKGLEKLYQAHLKRIEAFLNLQASLND